MATGAACGKEGSCGREGQKNDATYSNGISVSIAVVVWSQTSDSGSKSCRTSDGSNVVASSVSNASEGLAGGNTIGYDVSKSFPQRQTTSLLYVLAFSGSGINLRGK